MKLLLDYRMQLRIAVAFAICIGVLNLVRAVVMSHLRRRRADRLANNVINLAKERERARRRLG